MSPKMALYRALLLVSLFGLVTAGMLGWYISSVAGGRIGLGVALCVLLATGCCLIGGFLPLWQRVQEADEEDFYD